MKPTAIFGNLDNLLSQMVADKTPATVDSGDPHMAYAELASDSQLESGVWSATVGGWTIDSYSVAEVMLILSGRLRITDDEGIATELGKGDVFYLPKGWRGRWDVLEDMQKMYVIVY